MDKSLKVSQRGRWASTPGGHPEGLTPRNWRRFSGLVCGFGDRRRGPREAVSVHQVHGRRVIVVDDLDPLDHADIDADALVVTRPGRIAAVKTADCVPILLIAPAHGWGAAVHAGWRGTLARIVDAVIAEAAAAAIEPGEMYAAIGPSIGPCCYQVGEEVASSFDNAGLSVVNGDVPRLDLRAINTDILTAAGLRSSRIQVCGPCTRCQADRYYSHRAMTRGNGECGRQLSWIGWRDQRQQKDRRESA